MDIIRIFYIVEHRVNPSTIIKFGFLLQFLNTVLSTGGGASSPFHAANPSKYNFAPPPHNSASCAAENFTFDLTNFESQNVIHN